MVRGILYTITYLLQKLFQRFFLKHFLPHTYQNPSYLLNINQRRKVFIFYFIFFVFAACWRSGRKSPPRTGSLARIIHLVENAQAQRARSQTFIDGFARYYTPAMIAFALALVIIPPLLLAQPFSTWLYRGLVVLVIACPCALVISTPVSIVCGLTRAAREGILFKGGVYLEELGRIRTFFFDKTGTLTKGNPEVVHIESFCDLPEEELLRLAAALESRSEHPLAGAILDAAGRNGASEALPAPTFVQAVPGMGIRGR